MERTPSVSIFFVFAPKLTNFGSRRTVCEPFADGTAQVCSPVHTYAHLVREPFGTLMYTMLYRSVVKKVTLQKNTSGLRIIKGIGLLEKETFGVSFTFSLLHKKKS